MPVQYECGCTKHFLRLCRPRDGEYVSYQSAKGEVSCGRVAQVSPGAASAEMLPSDGLEFDPFIMSQMMTMGREAAEEALQRGPFIV